MCPQEKTSTGKQLWSDPHQELKITEPEIDLLDETFKPVFGSKSSCEVTKLTMDIKSKRSRSSPSLSLLFQEPSSNTSPRDPLITKGSGSVKKQPSGSDISLNLHTNTASSRQADMVGDKEKKLQKVSSVNKDDPALTIQSQLPLEEKSSDKIRNPLVQEDTPAVEGSLETNDTNKHSAKHEILPIDQNVSCDGAKKVVIPEMEVIQRLSVCLEERRNTLELPHLDNDDGGNLEDLDMVEPWEDLSSTKQWVTSPLHSPDVEELLNQLSPFSSCRDTLGSQEAKTPSPSADDNKPSLTKSTEHLSGNISHAASSKPKTTWTYLPSVQTRVGGTSNNAGQAYTGKSSTTKQKNTASSQRFYRQTSYEAAASDKREEHYFSKHRPYSLNLDTGHRCIRDISNQQNRNSSEFSSCPRGLLTSSGSVNNGLPSELELFLTDRQAPLRRNSAPVSVSSVRTAFMIKTCQAKAVPVIPPRVQYSQIPHSRQENEVDAARQQEKEFPKMSVEKSNTAPPPMMSDLKEELENKEPAPKHQKHTNVDKCAESVRTTSTPELPVITRRHAPSLEVFVDGPRPNRGNILQRPSFRNRQRPQSLILLSPPFPIMDYPPSGDDGKLLSSIKSLNDTSAGNVFSKEVADGIPLQNKMTIPKSGQRLETSTSCFYQPQRRSMIFDSRSHRQIEWLAVQSLTARLVFVHSYRIHKSSYKTTKYLRKGLRKPWCLWKLCWFTSTAATNDLFSAIHHPRQQLFWFADKKKKEGSSQFCRAEVVSTATIQTGTRAIVTVQFFYSTQFASRGRLHWLQKDARLYVRLWEN